MNTRRILVGTVVLGVLANAMDWGLNTYVWSADLSALPWVNPTMPLAWLIFADFVAALMLMVAWDRFGVTQGSSPAAGFRFGLFAGAFITFPADLVWQIYVKDFPYALAWKLIIVSVLFYGVLGAVAGALEKKVG